MSVEFYMDRVSNYQLGGQYLNVDFGRLPASRQAEVYRALGNPMEPANLAIITQARADFAEAFQQVSALGTLPAPQLGGGGIPFPMGAVDLIVAYLMRENFESALNLSITAREMVVKDADKEMDLGDKEKAAKLEAAKLQMVAQIVTGAVGAGAGVGSGVASIKAGAACRTDRAEIADLNIEKKKLDAVQQQGEHSVKNLQEQAQANTGKAKQLKGYVDEVNSKEGLSEGSRKKIDDEIVEKKAQMAQCDSDMAELQKAIDHKETAAKDARKSEAEKKELTKQAYQLEHNKKELKAKKDRLKEDVDALEAVGGLQSSRKQIDETKAEIERLQKEITTDTSLSESQKRAKQYKVERLDGEMKALTKEHVEAGTVIDKHTKRLEGEAQRMTETAAAQQKAWQDDVKSRHDGYEALNAELTGRLQERNSRMQNFSPLTQSINAAAGVVSGPVNAEGQEKEAEAGHLGRQSDFLRAHRDGTGGFADRLADMALKVSDTEKAMQDNRNEVMTSIAHNI